MPLCRCQHPTTHHTHHSPPTTYAHHHPPPAPHHPPRAPQAGIAKHELEEALEKQLAMDKAATLAGRTKRRNAVAAKKAGSNLVTDTGSPAWKVVSEKPVTAAAVEPTACV